METSTFEIILLAVFLFLSAFFSGTETALFSIGKSDLHRFAGSANKRERAIARLMEKPYAILITLLTGNLFVNIVISALMTRILLLRWPLYGQFISIALVTPFVIIFCEITPKAVAINTYRTLSRKIMPLFGFFHRLLYPVRFIMLSYSEFIIHLFRLKVNPRTITEDELGHAINVGLEEGILDKEESEFIRNVLRFSKKEASNIMFPRNRSVFLPYGTSIDDAIRVFLESDVIRVPVFKGDLDHVVGMVDSRDLIPYYMKYKHAKNINRFIREIEFFPATRELDDLLRDFIERKIQIAIVVDEYGGTAGVVTLNAILSELMGKEFTKWEVDTRSDIRSVQGNVTVISGDMQISDFNISFNEKLESFDSDTMGGYIIEKLAHLPRRGEELRVERHLLKVKHIRKNRIESIEVISPSAPETKHIKSDDHKQNGNA